MELRNNKLLHIKNLRSIKGITTFIFAHICYSFHVLNFYLFFITLFFYLLFLIKYIFVNIKIYFDKLFINLLLFISYHTFLHAMTKPSNRIFLLRVASLKHLLFIFIDVLTY